jgi:hypothetical protein
MAEQGTGIQELMAAETRASQIVAEARIGMANTCIGRPRHCRRLSAVFSSPNSDSLSAFVDCIILL